jgi:hypothetical protein
LELFKIFLFSLEGEAMEREEQLSAHEVEDMAWQYQTRGGGNRTAMGRDKFPVLTTMATLLRGIGWLALAGGVLLAFFEVFPWLACIWGSRGAIQFGGFGYVSCGFSFLIFAPMLGSFAIGFGLIALGELIAVFRAIEGNTHQLIGSVEQAWNQIKLTAGGGEH